MIISVTLEGRVRLLALGSKHAPTITTCAVDCHDLVAGHKVWHNLFG